MIKKRCSKCKDDKELEKFPKSKYNKDGYHHYCKECNSIDKKNRYATNEEYRHKQKNSVLKKKYNLSIKEVELKIKKQKGKCTICGKRLDFKNSDAHVDHDHKTGKIRDVLCRKCNFALGQVNDDIDYMNQLILYVKKHSIDKNIV